MPLFRIAEGKFQRLKPNLAKKERDLQNLIEENLLEALDVHFLETEYRTTSGGRIDTLGVDRNGAPTIIEYKRNQNDNVINQSLSYLKWLKDQKSEFFEMLITKRLPKLIADDLVLDWKNPRIICIAESFNRFDIDTVEIVPIRIELITYRYYEDNVFSLEPSQVAGQRPSETIETIVRAGSVDPVTDSYSVDSKRARGTEEVQSIFDDIRARILALGPQVVERSTKSYMAYRVSKNFLEVHIHRSQLRLFLRPIDYDDPEGMVTKIPDTFNWTLDREVRVNKSDELDYVMRLIEQSYNDVT